jgi:spermidine synthase
MAGSPAIPAHARVIPATMPQSVLLRRISQCCHPADESPPVIPWNLIDTSTIPNGAGQLRLMQRGAEFSIMLERIELMNSRLSGSEEALATMTRERVGERKRPRILIGGLGMGFTLRAALASFAPDAEILVAELVPAVVAWARGPMAPIFGTCLDDPRVSIEEVDVGKVIRSGRRFDAILLDVDNGPEGLTRRSNDRLYDLEGLASTRAALAPKGVLAVWSQGPDPKFTQRLLKIGLAVDEVRVRANKGRSGARHTIWFASTSKAPGSRRPPTASRTVPSRAPPRS